MNSFNIYIGYDAREHVAAEVCKHSILSRTDQRCPPDVNFLRSKDIAGFARAPETNQSTDFTYTRFMIPFMQKYKGWSLFCDCDFLFVADVLDLMYSVDESKAVSVVKHPPYIPHTQVKMDGVAQHAMPRKNWASLIVFNNSHPSNLKLTPDYVNNVTPGRRLHQFDWLKDDEIGSLHMEWNTLDDYYYLENPKAIHYTDGGPWFHGYTDTMYSQLWLNEYADFLRSSSKSRPIPSNA